MKICIGDQFGRLTVTNSAVAMSGQERWTVQCICGSPPYIARAANLRRGLVRSCGCARKETLIRMKTIHGMSKAVEYRAWLEMRARCSKIRRADFARYGGRGIRVCERWNSFENFLTDMGLKPSSDHSIERCDNSGNYDPANCKWATRKEQACNKRNNRILTFNNESLILAEWSRRTKKHQTLITWRLARGWTIERALMEPVMDVNTSAAHARGCRRKASD